MQQSEHIPRVVVVGGGAGGLELVAKLARKMGKSGKITLTLVDCSPVHLWKPLLHEAAAGTLYSYEDEIDYLAYASELGFRFCLGTLCGLNRTEKTVCLAPLYDDNKQEIVPERKLPYDILVIAIGSIANDFNIPGVREHCLFLDNVAQANQFHQLLIKTLMHQSAKQQKDQEKINIAIVGAGATGVELAAELHYAIRQMARYGSEISPDDFKIILIEAGDRVLPSLSERLSTFAHDQLTQLGITIYTSERIVQATATELHTHTGKIIPSTIKTWAAGIKAPLVLAHLDGLEVNSINQLLVRQTLQTTVDDSIFALGDCSYCPQNNSRKSVPARAQAAHQEATFLLKTIHNYLRNKPLAAYHFQDHGSLISLSYYETIGNLMGRIIKSLQVEGKLARIAYLSLYRMHQIALYRPWRVALQMFSRSLSRRIRPRLKLH